MNKSYTYVVLVKPFYGVRRVQQGQLHLNCICFDPNHNLCRNLFQILLLALEGLLLELYCINIFFRILDKYCNLSLHRFCCHFHVGWSVK